MHGPITTTSGKTEAGGKTMAALKLDNMAIVRQAIAAGNNRDNEQAAALVAAKFVTHALYDAYSYIKGEQTGYEFETTQEEADEAAAHEWAEFPQMRTSVDEMFAVGNDKVL